MISQYYRFMLGSFECYSISDGSMNYQIDFFFVDVPREQIETALRQRGLPTEHITTPYTCLFINTGEHRTLVDVGLGNLAPSAGKLLQNMQAAGIDPKDIDTIIITHAHGDHIGGNLDEEGNPIYPNAHYWIAKEEWEFWTSEAAEAQAPPHHVALARQQLAPIQDRLTFIDQESEIVPGISAVAAPGHTPGHTALSITSNDEQLLHVSDVVIHPLHLEHPDWASYDIQPEKAAVSKYSIFNRAADEKALVFAHHFPPFPNLGHIVRQANGWSWQPITTVS